MNEHILVMSCSTDDLNPQQPPDWATQKDVLAAARLYCCSQDKLIGNRSKKNSTKYFWLIRILFFKCNIFYSGLIQKRPWHLFGVKIQLKFGCEPTCQTLTVLLVTVLTFDWADTIPHLYHTININASFTNPPPVLGSCAPAATGPRRLFYSLLFLVGMTCHAAFTVKSRHVAAWLWSVFPSKHTSFHSFTLSLTNQEASFMFVDVWTQT